MSSTLMKPTAPCQKTFQNVVRYLLLCSSLVVPWLNFTASAATSTQIEEINSLLVARKDHTATPLNDGRVLIAGGVDANGALDSAEGSNPSNKPFTAACRTVVARTGHTATLLST